MKNIYFILHIIGIHFHMWKFQSQNFILSKYYALSSLIQISLWNVLHYWVFYATIYYEKFTYKYKIQLWIILIGLFKSWLYINIYNNIFMLQNKKCNLNKQKNNIYIYIQFKRWVYIFAFLLMTFREWGNIKHIKSQLLLECYWLNPSKH